MNRRLEKEISQIDFLQNNFYIFEKNYPDLFIYIIPNDYSIYRMRYTLYVQITYSKSYPFKAPKVIVNKYDYKRLLRTNPNDLRKYFQLDISCLCCSTILCNGNWAPVYNTQKILKEIENNIILKIRLIEKLHCKKIKDKYLIDDVPILEFI